MTAIPLREIKRRLDDMKVNYADIAEDRAALELRLLAQCARPERHSTQAHSNTQPSGRRRARRALPSEHEAPRG